MSKRRNLDGFKVDRGERPAVSGSWASVRREAYKIKAGPFRMTGPGRTRTRAERDLARQRRLLRGRSFGSEDEKEVFLAASAGKDAPPESDLERAQELVYDAWEASGERRGDLARKALELSPLCADAYLLLAELAPTLEERTELCERAVEAGQEALEEAPFEDTSDQWTRLEARPYLRARAGLARCLWELGDTRRALSEYLVLMDLNPGDNLGLRYLVLPLLIEAGHFSQATSLARQWSGEPSGEWTYNLALLLFWKEGASQRAKLLLRNAVATNARTPEYLLGLVQLPATLPDVISFGSEEEAIDYALRARGAWSRVPGALDWLGEVCLEAAG